MPETSISGINFTIVGKADDAASSIERLTKKLLELSAALSVSGNSTGTLTSSLAKIGKAAENAMTNFGNIGTSAKTASSAFQDVSTSAVAATESVSGVAESTSTASQSMAGIADSAKTATAGLSSASEAANTVSSGLSTASASASATASNLDNVAATSSTASTELKQVAAAAKKTEKATVSLGSSVKNMGKSFLGAVTGGISFFLKSLARIAFYRFIRTIIKEITQAIKEGIQNVYEYSKQVGSSFAPAMDKANAAIQQWKNSLGAMLAPLLEALIPLFIKVVNWVIRLNNAIGELIARLTGQTTFLAAKEISDDWQSLGDSAEEAGNQAKEALKYLAPFDELNRLPGNNGGGGGSGGGSTVDGFEERAVEPFDFSKIFAFFDKLEDYRIEIPIDFLIPPLQDIAVALDFILPDNISEAIQEKLLEIKDIKVSIPAVIDFAIKWAFAPEVARAEAIKFIIDKLGGLEATTKALVDIAVTWTIDAVKAAKEGLNIVEKALAKMVMDAVVGVNIVISWIFDASKAAKEGINIVAKGLSKMTMDVAVAVRLVITWIFDAGEAVKEAIAVVAKGLAKMATDAAVGVKVLLSWGLDAAQAAKAGAEFISEKLKNLVVEVKALVKLALSFAVATAEPVKAAIKAIKEKLGDIVAEVDATVNLALNVVLPAAVGAGAIAAAIALVKKLFDDNDDSGSGGGGGGGPGVVIDFPVYVNPQVEYGDDEAAAAAAAYEQELNDYLAAVNANANAAVAKNENPANVWTALAASILPFTALLGGSAITDLPGLIATLGASGALGTVGALATGEADWQSWIVNENPQMFTLEMTADITDVKTNRLKAEKKETTGWTAVHEKLGRLWAKGQDWSTYKWTAVQEYLGRKWASGQSWSTYKWTAVQEYLGRKWANGQDWNTYQWTAVQEKIQKKFGKDVTSQFTTSQWTAIHDYIYKNFGSGPFTSDQWTAIMKYVYDSIPYYDKYINVTANVTDLTSYNNKGKKAKGGAYYGGRWHNIPQYASGGSPHGTLFWAGEAGPEVVGHAGGRTEVLNASQLGAAVAAGVAKAINSASFSISGTPTYSAMYDDDAETEEAMYRAFVRAWNAVDHDVNAYIDGEPVYTNVVRRNKANTRMTGVNALA